MSTIDEIKSRLDIVDIISEDVKLRRSGKNYTGFCPFHANTRTPAFVVFPESGTWRCFGECNEGGDIFRYVMKKHDLDFREALKMLAERAGVKLESYSPQRQEEDERAKQLRVLLEEAQVFYRHQLLNTQAGSEAMTYLREKRGISAETAESWGIGYAPLSWDATLNHFLQKGYTQADILEAGLLTEKPEGGVYDRFRHRVMFPIRDASGGLTGFGGRVLNPDDVPKFMNSPQSILFDKSRLLYGLDKARRAIRSHNQAVIVEGYLDVILVHQAGFENVVSPMGTALTEAQMRQLKRYTRRFVLALDADAAGVRATMRGLEVARDALDHSTEMVFDARGLLHQEARLSADLRVSTLPEGLDPDEIVLRDREEWQRIIADAKPIITHVLETLVSQRDITDPKVKSEIAARILPLVRDVPNPVERDAYHQQVARTLQVDEGALSMLTGQRSRPPRTRSRKNEAQPSEERTRASSLMLDARQKLQLMESEILRYLVRDPEKIYRINRCLQSNQLERLNQADFSLSEHQQVADIVLASLSQDEKEPALYVSETLPEEMDHLLEEIESPADYLDEKIHRDREKRVLEEVTRQIIQIRQMGVNMQISQLRFLEEAQQPDEEVSTYYKEKQTMQMGLIRMRGLLDRALAKPLQFDT